MGAPTTRTFPNKPRSQRYRVQTDGAPAMRRQHSGHLVAKAVSPKSKLAQHHVAPRPADQVRPAARARPAPQLVGQDVGYVLRPDRSISQSNALPIDRYANAIRAYGPDYYSHNLRQVMGNGASRTTPVQVPNHPAPVQVNHGDVLDLHRVLHAHPKSPSRTKAVAANGGAPRAVQDQSSDAVKASLELPNGGAVDSAGKSPVSTPKKKRSSPKASASSPKPEYQWHDASLAAQSPTRQPRGYRTPDKLPRELQESTEEMVFPADQRMTADELKQLRRAIRPFDGLNGYAVPGISSRAMYEVTAQRSVQGPYRRPPQNQMASEGVSKLLVPPERPAPRRNDRAARRMHSSPSWMPMANPASTIAPEDAFQTRRAPVKRHAYQGHAHKRDHVKPLWNGRQSAPSDPVRPQSVQSPTRKKLLADNYGLDPSKSIIADHSAADRTSKNLFAPSRPATARGRVQAARELQSNGFTSTLGVSTQYGGSVTQSHKALRSRRVADMCGRLNLSFGYEPKGQLWSDKINHMY